MNMNLMTSRKNTYFIKSKTAKFVGAAFVLALTVSFIGLSMANHTTGAGTPVDTGWIDGSAFVGSVESVCGVTVGNVWGQRGDQFSINNDGSVPAGTYTIDIRAHYGFYDADPQAPQTDETMRVSTSADSRSIADLNGAGGSRPDRDDCGQMAANVRDYTNITGTPINYTSGPMTFAGLTGNSQSINIIAVRIHGTSIPPVDPAVCNFLNATPSTIISGGASVLTWSVSNATSMSIDHGVGGVALYDTGVTVHPTTNTTYTLTAVGAGGNDTCSATVTVNSTPTNPAVSITKTVRNVSDSTGFSNSVNADPGETVEFKLIVSSTGNATANNVTVTDTLPSRLSATTATSFSLGNMSVGSQQTNLVRATVAGASSFSVGTTTLTNTASVNTSNAGSDSDTANVVVTIGEPNTPVCTMTANPSTITIGQSSILTWSTTNATVVSISGLLASAPLSGSQAVTPSTTTTYTLNATGPGGSVTCPATVTVNSVNNPELTIDKTVRNATAVFSTFNNSVYAIPNDLVEFKIVVTNTGLGTANSVVVTDVLPNNFSLSSGSLTSTLGSMAPGATQTVNITARVAQVSNFPIGSSTWTNTATATASNANTVSDSANVVVTREGPPGDAQLSITKEVRNVTDGVAFYSKSIDADSFDQVEFRIRVQSSGQVTANNVTLTDILPNGLSLSYAQTGSGVTGTSTQFNLGNMSPNTTRTVSLFVTVSGSNYQYGNSTYVNSATVTASNANSVTDSATVRVNNQSGNPFLTINKEVRNLDNNSGFSNSTNAEDNDRVEFRITVRNTGNTSSNATNVRLRDFLPSGLTFISGTLRVDGVSNYSNNLFSDIFLGSMFQGQTKTVTFETRVNANFNNTITNTATVQADNTSPVSDSASVFVSRVIGGNIDLVLSKSAFNQTQSRDATSITARAGDSIEYTLRVENRGNATATNFVVEDNIADILELADLTTNSGATFDSSARVLRWSNTSINAGQTVERRFTVRVKNPIPTGTDLVMTNVYGNTVQVRLGTPPPITPPYKAPPTGPATTISLILSGLTAAGVFGIRKIRLVNSLKNN
ncbi:MAG: hypothetical protein Q8P83_03210 [bacterium]|nr:hypothetical protein [bacterium]